MHHDKLNDHAAGEAGDRACRIGLPAGEGKKEQAAEAAELLRRCYTLTDEPVKKPAFIKGVVR